ncbi:MAG: hypothetical protein AAGA55_00810 [Planctomycetota bacterium]
MNTTPKPSRRAFTLVETTLAMVIAGLVLLSCMSVFIAASRTERAYAQRFERTNELWTTQLAVRRTFLSLLMDGQTTADDDEAVRPRVILEPDPGAPVGPGGTRAQRLEVTVARSPVPSILGSQVGAWLVEADRESSLDFTSTDLSSGAIRGVFELRPSGSREAIMMNLGLTDLDQSLLDRMQTDPPPGWTLWWRPILSAELAELEAGVPPRGDLSGNAEAVRTRLAGAMPVLEGIDTLRWTVFKGDERIHAYAATSIVDLPAFTELEVLLINGQYANWMFEVAWESGDEPTSGGDDADGATAQDADGGGGGNNGAGGARPGGNSGGLRDVGDRTGNLGGGSR